MARRDRVRRKARQESTREPYKRLLVVCEGVTEQEYVKGFQSHVRNPRVDVVVYPECGMDPKSLVQIAKVQRRAAEKEAKRLEDEGLRYEEVWCIVDVDEHETLLDAIVMARDNGIELLISDPCFELWLLLHFREQPGARERGEMESLLRQFHPGYDKHVKFELLAIGYDNAHKRALRLHTEALADGVDFRNPMTSVYRLTESIRDEASLRND